MGAPEWNTNSVFSKPSTLCWQCANAVPDEQNGCDWSRHLMPVVGWTVQESRGRQPSYRVIACPEFKSEVR